MIKKIIKAIAIVLSVVQIFFVISFLANNTSDNMPLFVFLFVVPVVSLIAIIFKEH